MARDDSESPTAPRGGSTQVGRPEPSVNALDPTVTPQMLVPASADETALAPQARQPSVDLEALPTVDDKLYAIGMEIGRGGMGRILAARDRKLRRNVVIKVLRSPGHSQRFEREALITARLQHPSIVRVYDAGSLGGEPFYAMEMVRGLSLDRKVAAADDAQGRLALLPHVIAIADALAYAHSEGVIHRDLKPANVLVGSFGETVVIDWGLAKDLRRADPDSIDPDRRVPGPADESAPAALSGDLTVAGAVMGTPAYMPPEQARGEPADERSDVYAIGAILYTVLAGTPPITGERALDDARAGGITPLRERAPEMPDELVTIVEHAMAFDPAERYATARELADDLRSFAAGKLVARHSYSTGDLIRRWLKRHRAAVAVAASAFAVLGVLSVFGVTRLQSERDRAEDAADRADAARRDAEDTNDNLMIRIAERVLAGDPSTAIAWLQRLSPRGLERQRARELANAAAQAGVAFELSGPRGDIQHVVAVDGTTAYTASDDGAVWRWQLNAFTGDSLGGHTGKIESLAVSPDGWWLASAGTDRQVRIWNLDRVEAIAPRPGHTGGVRCVVFSPDGNTIASAGDDGQLWLWTIPTGEGKKLLTDPHPLRTVIWSRDGKRLWAGAGDGRVLEVDVATGKASAILRPHQEEVRVLALSPDGTQLASGGEDGLAFVWSVAERKPRSLGSHADMVRDIRWTPDGAHVVTAGGDAIVRVVDVTGPANARPVELAGNTAGVKAIAISPDGFYVAAAGLDGKARIWPITGGPPRTLAGHRASVKSLAFTPDGTKLLTASDDDRLRMWPLQPPPPAPSGAELARWLAARTNVGVAPP